MKEKTVIFPLKDIKDKGDWLKTRNVYLNKIKSNELLMRELNSDLGLHKYDRNGSTLRLYVKTVNLNDLQLSQNGLPKENAKYSSILLRWCFVTPSYNNGKGVLIANQLSHLVTNNSKHSQFVRNVLHIISHTHLKNKIANAESQRCLLNASNIQCTAIIKQLDQLAPFFEKPNR